MKIKKYYDKLLNETVYCGKHSSGLEIRVLPKEGYESAYAVFGVNYGSIDTYIEQKDGSFNKIPEGTAHFLEHKLFESEELDAFELFSRTGASANAYTSFDKTAYLFKGSDKIDVSLGYLLEFVQNPYFTAETVKKEQGIIGQEIRMYLDIPDWVVLFNLLKALYADNPVTVDIAGTQDSIAQIDDKLLYELYEKFYNPSNMVLCIAGNIDPDKVFEQVENSIIRKKKKVPARKFTEDKSGAVKHYAEQKLDVGRKQFLLGFKENIRTPYVSLKDGLATEILLEALFGKATKAYSDMLDSGCVGIDFLFSMFDGFGFSVVYFEGGSDNPEKAASMIKDIIKRAKKNGIDKKSFERAKRKIYGRMITDYNSIDDLANLLMGLYFRGYEPFAEINAVREVTYEDVSRRLSAIKEKNCALSVINPMN